LRSSILLTIFLVLFSIACTEVATPNLEFLTPQPTSTPSPTLDPNATQLPPVATPTPAAPHTPTPIPTPLPDIQATITAAIAQAIASIPLPVPQIVSTPEPTMIINTPTPEVTEVPTETVEAPPATTLEPTITPTPTVVPTFTPIPTPTPQYKDVGEPQLIEGIGDRLDYSSSYPSLSGNQVLINGVFHEGYIPDYVQVWQIQLGHEETEECNTERPIMFVREAPLRGMKYTVFEQAYTWEYCVLESRIHTDSVIPWIDASTWTFDSESRTFNFAALLSNEAMHNRYATEPGNYIVIIFGAGEVISRRMLP